MLQLHRAVPAALGYGVLSERKRKKLAQEHMTVQRAVATGL